MKQRQFHLDDFTYLLIQDDARLLVDLLKLAVTGRCRERSRESLSKVLSALGSHNLHIGDMLLELCVTELEDVATDTERLKAVPQPVVQESSHPYSGERSQRCVCSLNLEECDFPFPDDSQHSGNVRVAGADGLRLEFDRQCSTERRHDPITIMDGTGRIVSIRSGREWSDWSAELTVSGDEIKWKFNSDGSVNGWGWRFTVYPIMPAAGPQNLQSDRSVLSRPSMDLVMWLLDSTLSHSALNDRQIGPRLAAALAACAQLSALPAAQRMWSLQSLRKFMTHRAVSLNISQMIMSSSTSAAAAASASEASMSSADIASAQAAAVVAVATSRPYSDTALAVLVKGLPEMLLRQFEYEDPIVRGGKHLLHSAFFKELVALACDLGLDSLHCCSETYKWSWFRRYCMAARVAKALIQREELPPVCDILLNNTVCPLISPLISAAVLRRRPQEDHRDVPRRRGVHARSREPLPLLGGARPAVARVAAPSSRGLDAVMGRRRHHLRVGSQPPGSAGRRRRRQGQDAVVVRRALLAEAGAARRRRADALRHHSRRKSLCDRQVFW